MKTYSSLVHLNGNLLCAVDLETTGRRAGYHEILQIAVLPLNSDLRPLPGVRPFYTTVRPEHPERQDGAANHVHGLNINEIIIHSPTQDRVQDMLTEWVQKLDLPVGKMITPLAHNWAFEAAFLKAWLGNELFDQLFHSHARDGMLYAITLNDKAAFAGEILPFGRVGLGSLAKRLGISHEHAHDALADCVTEAEVYRALIHTDLF